MAEEVKIARLDLQITSQNVVKAEKALKEFKEESKDTEKQVDKQTDAHKRQDRVFQQLKREYLAVVKEQMRISATAQKLIEMYEAESAKVRKLTADYKVLERVYKKTARTEPAAMSPKGGGLSAAEKSAKELGRNYDALAGKLKTLIAVYAGFTLIQRSTKVAADFSETIALVGAVTGALKRSKEEYASLEQQARQLGATTRFSAQQAAEAQLALARAGFKTNEILAANASVLDLAAAGQLSLARSAEIAAITLRQFGLDASETARVANVLVHVSNNATTDVEQLAEAMKYVAPVASGLGFTLEETAAALGALSDAGLQSSIAGTGLRGVFAALSKPSADAAATIELLANRAQLSADAFDITKHKLEDVFRAFVKAKAGPSDFFRVFGRLQTPAAIALTKFVEKMDALKQSSQEVGDEAHEVASAVNNTLKGSLLNLNSAVEELYISIHDSLVGQAFRSLIDVATKTIRVLAGVEDQKDKNTMTSKLLAFAIKSMTVSLIAFGGWLTFVTIKTRLASMSALQLVNSLRLVKAALATTGIGLLVVLVGELAAAFMNLDKHASKLPKTLKKVKESAADRKLREIAEAAKTIDGQRINEMADAAFNLDQMVNQLNTRFQRANMDDKAKAIAEELDKWGPAIKAAAGFQPDQLITSPTILGVLERRRKEVEDFLTATIELEERTKKLAEARRRAAEERENAQKSLRDLQADLISEADLARLGGYGEEMAKLEMKVKELFLQMKGKKSLEALSPAQLEQYNAELDKTTQLFEELKAAEEFGELTRSAASAVEKISEAMRIARSDLATATMTGFDAALQQTTTDLADALKDQRELLYRSLADQRKELVKAYAETEMSTAELQTELNKAIGEFGSKMAQLDADVRKIATMRFGAQLAMDAAEAEQQIRDLLSTTDKTIDQFQTMESVAGEAMKIYNEQLRLGLISQDEFLRKQDMVTQSLGEFQREMIDLERMKRITDIAEEIGEAFGRSFEEFVFGAKTAKQAAKDFVLEIARILLRKTAIEPIVQLITKGIGIAVSAATAAIGGGGGISLAANGGVYSHGRVIPFARGGIVDSPTAFGLRNGTGLMGEAGPEAILPLKRGPDGRLGVSADVRPMRQSGRRPFVLRTASGSASGAPTQSEVQQGGGSTQVVNMNVYTPAADSFRRSRTQIAQDTKMAMQRMRR